MLEEEISSGIKLSFESYKSLGKYPFFIKGTLASITLILYLAFKLSVV